MTTQNYAFFFKKIFSKTSRTIYTVAILTFGRDSTCPEDAQIR